MATNLAGDICIGQFNVCLLRAARLDADCKPSGGVDSGIITPGIVNMTASPDIEEGTVFEPKNGCGKIAWTYEEPDVVKRYNLSGNFIFHDWEMMELLFGGNVINGRSGGPYPGKVIGYARPRFDDPPTTGVYIEVITKNSGEGVGDCTSETGGFPPYTGHIFGKVRLTPGERSFENDVAQVAFTGKATSNPNLFDGPWNDYPGAGYAPNSPYFEVGYSQAEYEAIEALARCGYQTLPMGS
jgi:hypothetical protein